MRQERTANHSAAFALMLLNQQPLPCQLDCHLINRKNQTAEIENHSEGSGETQAGDKKPPDQAMLPLGLCESCWYRGVPPPAAQEEERMWLQRNTAIHSA